MAAENRHEVCSWIEFSAICFWVVKTVFFDEVEIEEFCFEILCMLLYLMRTGINTHFDEPTNAKKIDNMAV